MTSQVSDQKRNMQKKNSAAEPDFSFESKYLLKVTSAGVRDY